MHDDQREDLVAKALAVARVRALRLGAVALHKTLIENERRRYEKDHGRIESPHAALRLVLEAPAFQWLHPLAEVIVQMDEKLAEDGAIGRGRIRGVRRSRAQPALWRGSAGTIPRRNISAPCRTRQKS